MKVIIGIVASLVVIGALIGVAMLKPVSNLETTQPTDSQLSQTAKTTPTPSSKPETKTTNVIGRYVDYMSTDARNTSYNTTILFFHAPWCTECRAFEQSIQESSIPEGVQILKVDYDSSSDLKKKYGVTIQTSFVKIDSSGNKVSSWVGYGKDKSVDAILKNT